jgi:hypothetical protein
MMLGTVGDWIADWLLTYKAELLIYEDSQTLGLATVRNDLCQKSTRLLSHNGTYHDILAPFSPAFCCKVAKFYSQACPYEPRFCYILSCSQDENDVDNLETKNATNDCKHVSETGKFGKRCLQMDISVVSAIN